MLFCHIVVPVLMLWNHRVRSSPIALFLITLAINIGMYLERYVIVTGFLRRNHLAFNWEDYFPSVVEIPILIVSSMELSPRASGARHPCART